MRFRHLLIHRCDVFSNSEEPIDTDIYGRDVYGAVAQPNIPCRLDQIEERVATDDTGYDVVVTNILILGRDITPTYDMTFENIRDEQGFLVLRGAYKVVTISPYYKMTGLHHYELDITIVTGVETMEPTNQITLNGVVNSTSLIESLMNMNYVFGSEINSSSLINADLENVVPIAGMINSVSSIEVNPIVERLISGSIDSKTNIMAQIEIGSFVFLNGSIVSISDISSDMKLMIALQSEIDSSSKIVAGMRLDALMDAEINSNSDIVASALIERLFEVSIDSISDVVSNLKVNRMLSGGINSVSSIESQLKVVTPMGAVINSSSVIVGDLSISSIPQRIPNLLAWYDANKLTLNNDDLVSTWTDSSGNGRHLTSSGADRPVFKTNEINGKPSLQFIQKMMTRNFGATFAQPNTILIVAKQVDTSGISRFFFEGIGGSNRHGFFKHADGQIQSYAGSTLVTSYIPANGTWFLGNMLFNTSLSDFRANGTSITTGNVGTQSLTGITVGSYVTGGLRLDCHISEIIIYNRKIDVSEINQIENYLNEKYNIF